MRTLPLFPGYRFGYPGETPPDCLPPEGSCTRCPRHEHGTPFIGKRALVEPSKGGARVLVVQSVPLSQDYARGTFASEYVHRLARWITAVGGESGVSYGVDVAAALACGKGDDHKGPASNHTKACRVHLQGTISATRYKAIVLIGTTPMLSVLDERVEYDTAAPGGAYLDGTPVVFFPEFYDWGNKFRIRPAEARLAAALTRPYTDDASAGLHARYANYSIIETPEEAEAVFAQIDDVAEGHVASIDVETSGRKFGGDHRMETIAVSWGEEDPATVQTAVFTKSMMSGAGRDTIARWVSSGDPGRVGLGGHFVSSDMASFKMAWGIEPRGFTWDTRTLRKLLNPNAGAALDEAAYVVGLGGLKAEAEEALRAAWKRVQSFDRGKATDASPAERLELQRASIGIKALKHEKEAWRAYAYGLLPEDILYRYVARDALSTLLLRKALLASVDREGLRWLWDNVAHGLHRVSYHMNVHGAPVETTALANYKVELDATMQAARDALRPHFPDATTDEEVETAVNSAEQVGALLKSAGISTGHHTETGRMRVEADDLDRLRGAHPAIGHILDHRAAAKLNGTYVEGLMARLGNDGRVHPTFLPIVESFRAGCRDPNLQNVPSRTEAGRRIRAAIVAPKGFVLVEHDYSQFQLRILAAESGDEFMVEQFARGADLHLESAKAIAPFWHKSPDQIGKEERSAAKTINFSLVFDKSHAVLAEELGVPVERAAALVDQILGKFVRVPPYMEGKKQEARDTGAVWVRVNGKNVYRRPLPEVASALGGIRANAERAASNTAVQGPEAVIAMGALVRLTDALDRGALPGARIVMSVHDSILGLVPEDKVAEYDRLAREAMAWLPIGASVPVVVDAKVGPNWADMKDLKLPA